MGRRLELSALRRDGTEIPVELTVSRAEVDGEPLFVGYVRDLSDARAQKAALEEAEARFRQLVEQVPTVTYICDAGEAARRPLHQPADRAVDRLRAGGVDLGPRLLRPRHPPGRPRLGRRRARALHARRGRGGPRVPADRVRRLACSRSGTRRTIVRDGRGDRAVLAGRADRRHRAAQHQGRAGDVRVPAAHGRRLRAGGAVRARRATASSRSPRVAAWPRSGSSPARSSAARCARSTASSPPSRTATGARWPARR